MTANLLLSAAVLGLFLALALRCLGLAGAPLPQPAGASGVVRKPYLPSRKTLLWVFLGALGLRLAMLLAIAAHTAFTNEKGLTWQALKGSFLLWDARHYINLIEQGYSGYQEDGKHIFLVFYPFYVWVVRAVRLAVPSTIGAGLLVSVVSYAWGCCWVYRLAGLAANRRTALYTVLLLSAYPFSFFFGTVMTEGLFLLTTSASLYFALRRKWLFYGIWGALAALTRMTGVLVMVPALLALLEDAKPLRPPVRQSLKKSWLCLLKALPLILLPLLGAAGYWALNWHVDGDPFAFAGHQEHWHQGGMWVSKVLVYIWQYGAKNLTQPIGWAVWLPELALFGLCFLLLALCAWREKAPAGLLAYGFCYLIANYSLSWLLSAGRYLSCGVAFFLFAAILTERRPILRGFLLVTEAVLLGAYYFSYLSHAPIM